jgi:hypothetical protein
MHEMERKFEIIRRTTGPRSRKISNYLIYRQTKINDSILYIEQPHLFLDVGDGLSVQTCQCIGC